MVTGFPATVRMALRERVEVFVAIKNVTVLEPLPFPPEEMVIHLTGLEALHWQALDEAPTVMLSKVGLAVMEMGELGTPNEHVKGLLVPACVTVTDLPAMVRVALRAEEEVLAAIEMVTYPDPVPLFPAVMVIHGALLVAVHVQELEDGVTVMFRRLAAELSDTPVEDSV